MGNIEVLRAVGSKNLRASTTTLRKFVILHIIIVNIQSQRQRHRTYIVQTHIWGDFGPAWSTLISKLMDIKTKYHDHAMIYCRFTVIYQSGDRYHMIVINYNLTRPIKCERHCFWMFDRKEFWTRTYLSGRLVWPLCVLIYGAVQYSPTLMTPQLMPRVPDNISTV